jgi:hypothetical protein
MTHFLVTKLLSDPLCCTVIDIGRLETSMIFTSSCIADRIEAWVALIDGISLVGEYTMYT